MTAKEFFEKNHDKYPNIYEIMEAYHLDKKIEEIKNKLKAK